jgi:hypothetical protein
MNVEKLIAEATYNSGWCIKAPDDPNSPDTQLVFQGFSDESITNKQIASCKNYLGNPKKYFDLAIAALVDLSRHYKLSSPPKISLTEVYFSRERTNGTTEFSFLFVSSMEPELGLAVRFVNGDLEYVGIQDEVL